MKVFTLLPVLVLVPNGVFGGHTEPEYASEHLKNDANDRLVKIEAVLESVLQQNAELERRIEVLEDENQRLKLSVNNIQQPQAIDGDGKTENKEAHERRDRDTDGSQLSGKRTDVKSRRGAVKTPRIVLSGEAPVAFTATISSPHVTNLGAAQTIVYDKVITNVGGGYHSTSGMFTAPATGVYVFSVETMLEPGDSQYLELVVDGKRVIPSYTHGSGESRDISSSRITTVQVQQGSQVWVRTTNSNHHGSGTIHGNEYSSFSGWLLAYTD